MSVDPEKSSSSQPVDVTCVVFTVLITVLTGMWNQAEIELLWDYTIDNALYTDAP